MQVKTLAKYSKFLGTRMIYLIIVLTGLLTTVIVYVRCSRLHHYEIRYKGEAFGAWLASWEEEYAENGPSTNFGQAVSQLGTNVIPALLQMLQEHRPVRDAAASLLQRQSLLRVRHTRCEYENYLAAYGFRLLGNKASNAVPYLIRIMDRKVSASSQAAAISALGNIGPTAEEAVPALLTTLSRGDGLARSWACRALSQIHKRPEIVVPALIEHLRDVDKNVRLEAVFALGEFGWDARTAVPALTEFTTGSDGALQDRASHALGKIRSSDGFGTYP